MLTGIDDVIQVSVGGDHLCILSRSGTSCTEELPWQSPEQKARQLSFHLVVDAGTRVRQLSSGSNHTCALTLEGEVLCWGHHGLGPGAKPVAPGVTRVPGLKHASLVAAGASHTCVLEDGGRVQCWGYNAQGQTGPDGLGGYVHSPRPVPGVERAIGLAAGGTHTCATLETGEVKCWGANWKGQLGAAEGAIAPDTQGIPRTISGLDRVRSLAAGGVHSCAILEDGSVACWGDNASGQCGSSPVPGVRMIEDAEDVVQISAGRELCMRSESGEAVCLANGGREPRRLGELSGVADIAAGLRHGCAVDTTGAVWCWGAHITDSKHGEQPFVYGDGKRPVKLAGIGPATSVTVGRSHSCALLEGGKVVCWGTGWLGDGEFTRSERPVEVRKLDRVRQIAAGQDNTYAIRDDGSVVCWGACGELGPEWQSAPLPTVVRGVDDARLVSVSTATCVVREAGRVTCLGSLAGSRAGAEGASTLGELKAIDLSVGLYWSAFACLVDQTGRVACWGDNRGGQLGDGTRTPRRQPVFVKGISNALHVSAGEDFACAILRGGKVSCWGEKAPGRAPTEHRDIQIIPNRIPGL